MSINEIRSELTKVSEKHAGDRGVFYRINKRDGSDYSLHKLMLPLSKSNETTDIDKENLSKNRGTVNFDTNIYERNCTPKSYRF
jgi:hypothetical protein